MSETTPELSSRRPLRSRDVPFFQNLAALLVRWGVSPDAISASSMAFGCLAGLCFYFTRDTVGLEQRVLWLLVAAFIQLRLMANLLDGMVAVEGKRGGPTGELWNEAPDRVSDVATIVGAGYAAGSSPILGWAAAAAALFVAYVRALGASAGTGQVFTGPMAKPQRMFWLTLVSLSFALFPVQANNPDSIGGVLLAFAIAGAFVDLKARGGRAARWRAAIVLLLASTAFTWRHVPETHWPDPVLPVVLLALTVGGVFTSILRMREVAAILRRIKGEARRSSVEQQQTPEKP